MTAAPMLVAAVVAVVVTAAGVGGGTRCLPRRLVWAHRVGGPHVHLYQSVIGRHPGSMIGGSMMGAAPAFPGAALWFLGNPTSVGMHAGTVTFTAGTAGTYRYLCPVPGHAQKGMVGAFQVG